MKSERQSGKVMCLTGHFGNFDGCTQGDEEPLEDHGPFFVLLLNFSVFSGRFFYIGLMLSLLGSLVPCDKM